MKYTIEGFSQEAMLGAGMDCTDACLLRFMVDFISTGKMDSRTWGEVTHYWFKYDHVLEEMPLLGLSSPDALARRLRKLKSIGVLLHKTRKDSSGTRSYFALSETGATLLFSRTGATEKSDPVRPRSRNIDSSSTEQSITDPNPSPPGPVVADDEKYFEQLHGRFQKAEETGNGAGMIVYGMEIMHGGPFANYPQEWESAKKLVTRLNTMSRGKAELRPALKSLLQAYQQKRRGARDNFWKEAPLTPSGVLCRLEQLVGAARKQREDRELDEMCIQAMRNGA